MLKANPKFVKQDDRSDLKKHVLQGKVILSLEGTVYSFDAIRKLITKPDTAQVETALQGPYSALAEDLDINLYLIRSSYNDSSLAIEYRRLGTYPTPGFRSSTTKSWSTNPFERSSIAACPRRISSWFRQRANWAKK
nr:spore germination protein [Cohnella faecalis]